MHDGNDVEARAQFQALCDRLPDSELVPEARIGIARIAGKANEAEAEQMFTTLVQNHPESPQASEALVLVAYLHNKQGKPKSAVQSDFVDVAARYPHAPAAMECRYRAARLMLREPPDYEAAFRSLDEVKRDSLDRRIAAEALADQGVAYIEKDVKAVEGPDVAKGLGLLASVRTQFPEQSEAIARAELRIARFRMYREGKPAEARLLLQKLVDDYPNNALPAVKYELAYCSYMEKNYQDCADKCLLVIQDKDQDPGWRGFVSRIRADCFYRIGDFETARKEFQKVVDEFPGTSFAENSARMVDMLTRALAEGK